MIPLPITRDTIRAQARVSGSPCRVQALMTQLPEDERQELAAALEDLTLPLPAIRRVLDSRGFSICQTTLHAHRHRQCRRCYGTGGR